MTLEQAIEHAERAYKESCNGLQYALKRGETRFAERCKKEAEENRQLAEWLRELVERRKAPEIVYCHECIHFQCNMRFDGSVPKGADAYECRRGCGGCDPMDYCSYGERAERRTDGRNR